MTEGRYTPAEQTVIGLHIDSDGNVFEIVVDADGKEQLMADIIYEPEDE